MPDSVSALVQSEIRRSFDDETADILIRELAAADIPDFAAPGPGRDRVHLAILRHAGRDAASFRAQLHQATRDWRDVLMGSGLEHADWRDVLGREGLSIS